ncbi:MAG TPA: hypothetical protein PKE04_01870 [Clostridia bacterium]|nr:hypothetical protein [Clostridia bacterium]
MKGNAALRARLQHLLSYLVVSMVPVLLCGILLIHSGYRQSVHEIEQTAYTGLGLMKSNYEYLLQSVDISVSHFYANEALNLATPADIAAQLAVYKANYPNFSEIIYYAKGSADIVASDGVHPYKTFQQNLPGDIDLDMSSLFVSLNGATSPSVLRARSKQQIRTGGDYLIFLQPVPVLSANPEGILTFFLPVDYLANQVDDCIGQPYALYVLADRNLTPLYRSEASRGKLEDRLNKLRGTGIFHERVGGEAYVFMRSLAESHPVYHLIAFSEKTLFARAIAERNRQMGLLCGLVALTALAAYALHSRIYQPIRQMIEFPLPQGDGGESVSDHLRHSPAPCATWPSKTTGCPYRSRTSA